MKYEWIRNPTMTLDDFEEANTAYLQEWWIEDNPQFAYMLNDGDLDKYVDDINRDYLKDVMCDLYREYLDSL